MLIKKIFLFLCVLSSQYIIINAQEYGTLRGLVTDSTTSEVLPYGNVFVKELGKGTSTDARGYFLLPQIPANKKFTLVVSYVGYQSKLITINLIKNKVTHYDIKLIPSGVELQTIEKIGERIGERNETNISIEKFTLKQLENIPKGVETDIFRSIKYLPGVQSTGDVSARYFVRGGNSNQNLVLVDGITLYNPFHALGLFSVIDPDIVNSVEFFKGGFGAQYGGRLSSVMSINTRDGNKTRYGAKASASFLSGKFFVEGPIPHGSFYLAGRKSLSNQVIKKFLNDRNVPVDFYDFNFKANYSSPDFIEGAKFSISALSSGDNIKQADPLLEDYKWKTDAFGFKWFQVGDVPLFYELGLSVSKFSGEVIPKFSSARTSSNEVDDISLTMDFTYTFTNMNELGVGFHVKQINTSLFYENDRDIKTDLGSSGTNIVFYLKYKLASLEFLKADIGMRLNVVPIVKSKTSKFFEPRINLNIKPFGWLSLKGSAGLIQQEMTTITDENEIISIYEPWVLAPDYLPLSYSLFYIFGFQINPSPEFEFDVEGYYKNAKGLSYINEGKITFLDRDFISGNSESYGVESALNYMLGSATFTSSYTLAYAFKEIDGLVYAPKYDVRHSVNLGLEYDFGNDWQVSTRWTYSSGLPFTQIVGYYDKLYFDDLTTPWNQYDPRNPYVILGVQNLGRLPSYHRLDFSISKKFIIDPFKIDIGFSVINLYDRKNIFYFKRDTGERVDMLPVLPSVTLRVEI